MKKRLVDADKLMERAKINSVLVTVEHDHHDYGLTLGTLNKIVKECELPSAQPERMRGRWISYRCDMYKCSECSYIYTELTDLHRCGAKYCPNCGADMRGEQDG